MAEFTPADDTGGTTGGGEWTDLQTFSFSGSNVHSFTLDAAHDQYRVVVETTDPEGNGSFGIDMRVGGVSSGYVVRNSDGTQGTHPELQDVIDAELGRGSCIVMLGQWTASTAAFWGYTHTGEQSATQTRPVRFENGSVTSGYTAVEFRTNTGETFGITGTVQYRSIPP